MVTHALLLNTNKMKMRCTVKNFFAVLRGKNVCHLFIWISQSETFNIFIISSIFIREQSNLKNVTLNGNSDTVTWTLHSWHLFLVQLEVLNLACYSVSTVINGVLLIWNNATKDFGFPGKHFGYYQIHNFISADFPATTNTFPLNLPPNIRYIENNYPLVIRIQLFSKDFQI